MSRETTLRHLFLAGLGVLARFRRSVDRIAARMPIAEEPPKEPPFVTTQKVAKRSTHSSGSRKAGERDAQRRIAGRGR
jgi:hypothetical protein